MHNCRSAHTLRAYLAGELRHIANVHTQFHVRCPGRRWGTSLQVFGGEVDVAAPSHSVRFTA